MTLDRASLETELAGGANLGSRWQFWPLVALSALVLVGYTVRLSSLPLRGEETRRAQIAVEMVRSGDWVVPRQQGLPLLSRPPLQNWLIALAGAAFGQIDVWAIRLPSVIALWLTVLLVYWYASGFLSTAGAFVAAVAMATFGQVLELGNLGETEPIFTLLVSSSLLVWHGGRCRGWSPWGYWTAAYVLVALGLLTKGLQAPVYFGGAVGAYLLATRRWRDAVSWPHVVGVAILAAIGGTWLGLFYRQLGGAGVRGIFGGDVALRFEDTSWTTVLSHLITYPVEVVVICLFPWSLLLAAFFDRQFRRSLGSARDGLLFVGLCLALTFPTCWLPPGARGRYFMPLYPCFAVLIGLVVDRCRLAHRRATFAPLWRHFLSVAALGMIASGVSLAGVSLVMGSASGMTPGATWLFLAAAVPLAALAYWSCGGGDSVRACIGGGALAVFALMMWNGPVVEAKLELANMSMADEVNAIRARLPAGAKLVSIGPTDHLFAYYYVDPIEQRGWPIEARDAAGIDWFCYSTQFSECPPIERLPFRFETLAVVSCERQRSDNPIRVVIIARRVPE